MVTNLPSHIYTYWKYLYTLKLLCDCYEQYPSVIVKVKKAVSYTRIIKGEINRLTNSHVCKRVKKNITYWINDRKNCIFLCSYLEL